MARFLEKQKAEGVFDSLHISKGGRGLVGEGRGIVFTAGNAVSVLNSIAISHSQPFRTLCLV